MDSIQALVLGIVQGITEFLPISSSAHLILTSKLMNLQDQGINFDVAVHFGSLLAVIIYFYKDSIRLCKGQIDTIKGKKSYEASLFKKITVATLPVIFIGLLLKEYVETTFRDAIFIIGFTSIFWGILLYFADKKEETIKKMSEIDYKTAFLMGIAQALAIIPGTSRSGSTMTIARFLNFSRKSSAEFSMLMSIPVITLMMIVNIYDIIKQGESYLLDFKFLLIGISSSFVFALLSIHILLKLVTKIGFIPFVIYRIALGLLIFYIIL